MAIAFDAVSNGRTASGASLTVAHTTTGSNRYLAIGVYLDSQSISTVTYNGVACTQSSTTGFGAATIYMFYIRNPASGAHNIVVTPAGTCEIIMVAASYPGTDQGTQNTVKGTALDGTGGNTSLNLALTTAYDNSLQVAVFGIPNGATGQGAGTATTSRTSNNRFSFLEKNAITTPAGSTTIQGAVSPATQMFICGIIINPDGISNITITETATLTETVTAIKGKTLTVAETATLTETLNTLAPRTPWTEQSENGATWTAQNKS